MITVNNFNLEIIDCSKEKKYINVVIKFIGYLVSNLYLLNQYISVHISILATILTRSLNHIKAMNNLSNKQTNKKHKQ